jgi:hypothetical protein
MFHKKTKTKNEVDTIRFDFDTKKEVNRMWDMWLKNRDSLELTETENAELDYFLYMRFNGLEGDTMDYGFGKGKKKMRCMICNKKISHVLYSKLCDSCFKKMINRDFDKCEDGSLRKRRKYKRKLKR